MFYFFVTIIKRLLFWYDNFGIIILNFNKLSNLFNIAFWGKEWLTTDLFRIGASSAANNILSAIEGREIKYFWSSEEPRPYTAVPQGCCIFLTNEWAIRRGKSCYTLSTVRDEVVQIPPHTACDICEAFPMAPPRGAISPAVGAARIIHANGGCTLAARGRDMCRPRSRGRKGRTT